MPLSVWQNFIRLPLVASRRWRLLIGINLLVAMQLLIITYGGNASAQIVREQAGGAAAAAAAAPASATNATQIQASSDDSSSSLSYSSSYSYSSPVSEIVRQLQGSSRQLRLVESKLKNFGLTDSKSGLATATACSGKVEKMPLKYLQNFPFAHSQPQLCHGSVFILFGVHSAVGNFRRRSTIRQTWGSLRYHGNKRLMLAFFVGAATDREMQLQVNEESDRFGDIVQSQFIENYRNMSIKHLTVYEWMLQFCSHAEFLVKVDDDTFVDVAHLTEFLSDSPPSGFYCSATRNAKPQRVRRGPKSKWTVTRREFAGRRYPTYCEGFGYALRVSRITNLFICSMFKNFFWIDDVYVTGILSSAANVPIEGFWKGHGYTGILPSLATQRILDYIFLVADYNEFFQAQWRKLWRAVLVHSVTGDG